MRAVDDLIGQVVAALQAARRARTHRDLLHVGQRLPARRASDAAEGGGLRGIHPGSLVGTPARRSGADRAATRDRQRFRAHDRGACRCPSRAARGRSVMAASGSAAATGMAPAFLVEHWAATTDLRWDVPTYAAVRSNAALGLSRDLVYVQLEEAAYTPEFYNLAVDPYQLWSQHGSIDPGRVQLQAWLRAWIAAAKTCRLRRVGSWSSCHRCALGWKPDQPRSA